MNFQQNYIKYKKKYLKLKKIQEGGIACNLAYKNIHDTCWMVATITCLCFGDSTSEDLENVMKSFKIGNQYKNLIDSKKCFIESRIQKVKSDKNLLTFFPSNSGFNIYDEKVINNLKKILDKFIDRYYSKVFEIKNLEKPEISDELNPERCELVISQSYKNIFNNHDIIAGKEKGGSIVDNYLFVNLLSIFFLGYKLSFRNYYNDKIKFSLKNDIGVLILTDYHVCCLFVCNKHLKYYNDIDKEIYKCDINILKNNINNLYIEKGQSLRAIDIKSYKGNKQTLLKVSFLIIISRKENKIFNDDFNKSFIMSSDINDLELLYNIGIYYEGINAYKIAIKLYEKAASQFHTRAAYHLGSIYEKGKVVETMVGYFINQYVINQDLCKAFKYYQLAADQGYIKAQYKLGRFYENGYGTTKDYCKALEYYKLTADQGILDALNNLGQFYENGWCTTKDYCKALEYYKLGADQGDKDAQENLKRLLP
jgi:hypothetical protein